MLLASSLFAWGGAVTDILDDDEGDKLTRLLDEDELLQEIKSHNEALVIFLAEPASVAQLVQLATQPLDLGDDLSDDEKVRRTMRWPYMACEVLCCDVSDIIDMLAIGSFEGTLHLEALLSIAKTKGPVEPRLAGYFEKVLGLMLRRKFIDVVTLIRSQGLDVFDGLARHLASFSMMQAMLKLLVPQIIAVDGAAHLESPEEDEDADSQNEPCVRSVAWDSEPPVARILINTLADPTAAEHVTELLLCALRHCGADSEFSANMSSASSVQQLIDLVKAQARTPMKADASVVLGAVCVLELIVHHCEQNECTRRITELSCELFPSSVEEGSPAGNGASAAAAAGTAAEQRASFLRERSSNVGALVCTLIPWVGEQLSADLDRPGTALFGASEPLPSPSPPASLTSMPSPSPPPSPLRPLESVPTEDKDGRRTLGALRFQLIRLVEAMVKLNSSDVDVALSKHDILPACLRLFFDFPFHSMMHRSVTAIVLTILDGDDVRAGEGEGDASARAASESHTSPHVILQRQLIENATLQRKILDAYERNREAEKLPKGRRDGYMGHLNQMSCAICKVSGESSRSAVSAMVAKSSVAAEWRAFVLSTLAAQTAFQCRPLGGFEFPRRMDESPNELADENDNDAMFSSESM